MKTIRYTHKKRVLALEELEKMLYCGEQAGIRHAMFMGFGVMLGQIMLFDPKKGQGDFIPEDDDMDMCIDADRITPEQEAEYFRQLEKNGLFDGGRRKFSFKDDDNGFDSGLVHEKHGTVPQTGRKVRFTWISLKHKHAGVKSCNWFFFKWGGYYWHSKGGRWVSQGKFDKHVYPWVPGDDGIMKGIPQAYLEEFRETKFHGINLQFPANIGTCADFWYPGWWLPKTGHSSHKQIICIVRKWRDEKTWKIVKA